MYDAVVEMCTYLIRVAFLIWICLVFVVILFNIPIYSTIQWRGGGGVGGVLEKDITKLARKQQTQKAQEKQISSSDSICENGKYQFVYEAYCKANALNMRWKRTNATANQTKRINLIKITLHICAYLSTLFHTSFTVLVASSLPPSRYYYSLSAWHFSVFTSTILIKQAWMVFLCLCLNSSILTRSECEKIGANGQNRNELNVNRSIYTRAVRTILMYLFSFALFILQYLWLAVFLIWQSMRECSAKIKQIKHSNKATYTRRTHAWCT